METETYDQPRRISCFSRSLCLLFIVGYLASPPGQREEAMAPWLASYLMPQLFPEGPSTTVITSAYYS